jgi:hypothetical protein
MSITINYRVILYLWRKLSFIFIALRFMNFVALKVTAVSLITTNVFASAAMAVPGTPIGGIIVKQGRNPPGGQTLVLTTKDADGKFTIIPSQGGDYILLEDQFAQTLANGLGLHNFSGVLGPFFGYLYVGDGSNSDPKSIVDTPINTIIDWTSMSIDSIDWIFLEPAIITDETAWTLSTPFSTSSTTHVPGPLPALGAAAAFGFSRKLRKRIKRSTNAVSSSYSL